MTDTAGNPEAERRTEFYEEPWAQEAVGRYIFSKVGNKNTTMEFEITAH